MIHQIEIIDAPELQGSVLFTEESARVFREDDDISPLAISDDIRVMPWGYDNQLPFRVMDLIDADETTSTCMDFNTEVAFGDGLKYEAPDKSKFEGAAQKFFETCDIDSVFLGQCADIKMFNFCVTAVILSQDLKSIEGLVRKEAAYCRFAVQNQHGRIPYVVYANWRNNVNKDNCEVIPLLGPGNLLEQLKENTLRYPKQRVYAVVSRVPKASSTYYPIPAYASIFRSDWYDIKRLIGKAKKAKLKNSAPIKYHIQLANGYWDRAIRQQGITDEIEQKKFVDKLKKQMVDFLSGADNSGKVLFSTTIKTADGKEIPEVTVIKISSDEKEGGDYTTDIQEAVNMICFAMRVHSNLVGSVPGKSQSNNSGSDKRELYTIAQTLQRPYHRLILTVHRLVCRFNGWTGIEPRVGIIQLTTLDQHKDLKKI